MPAKRKVLITGSGGMLGTDLCEELKKDHEVYGVDLVKREATSLKLFEKCDITNESEVLSVLSKIRPDIVIHTAAWTDVDGCELDKDRAYKINSEGTENVAIACEENDSTLIFLSTDFVFDGKKRAPYKETDTASPISLYGDSKLVGEETIQRIWPKHFIIRTSWLYGRSGKNFVDTIINKAATEKVLKVVEDQVGSPTYTKDLAKAINKLIGKCTSAQEHPAHEAKGGAGKSTSYGIYHVSNSGIVSWYEYAKVILKLAGSDTKVVPISSKELARPAKRPAMSVLDNTKFEKFSGYKMKDWEEALKEYIEIKKKEKIYAKKT